MTRCCRYYPYFPPHCPPPVPREALTASLSPHSPAPPICNNKHKTGVQAQTRRPREAGSGAAKGFGQKQNRNGLKRQTNAVSFLTTDAAESNANTIARERPREVGGGGGGGGLKEETTRNTQQQSESAALRHPKLGMMMMTTVQTARVFPPTQYLVNAQHAVSKNINLNVNRHFPPQPVFLCPLPFSFHSLQHTAPTRLQRPMYVVPVMLFTHIMYQVYKYILFFLF